MNPHTAPWESPGWCNNVTVLYPLDVFQPHFLNNQVLVLQMLDSSQRHKSDLWQIQTAKSVSSEYQWLSTLIVSLPPVGMSAVFIARSNYSAIVTVVWQLHLRSAVPETWRQVGHPNFHPFPAQCCEPCWRSGQCVQAGLKIIQSELSLKSKLM